MSTWLPKNQGMGLVAICVDLVNYCVRYLQKINFSTVIKLLFLVEVSTVMRMKMYFKLKFLYKHLISFYFKY